MDTILTVAQAAPIIGLSVRQVRHYCETGQLATLPLDGRDHLILTSVARAFAPNPPGPVPGAKKSRRKRRRKPNRA